MAVGPERHAVPPSGAQLLANWGPVRITHRASEPPEPFLDSAGLVSLPAGSVVQDSDGDRWSKRANGRWKMGLWSDVAGLIRSERLRELYGPLKLVDAAGPEPAPRVLQPGDRVIVVEDHGQDYPKGRVGTMGTDGAEMPRTVPAAASDP